MSDDVNKILRAAELSSLAKVNLILTHEEAEILLAEREQLKAELLEAKNTLNSWYMAWVSDHIGPNRNGVECGGLDQGLMLSCRTMKPILDTTRRILKRGVWRFH